MPARDRTLTAVAVVGWLFAACIVIQVFLAGLGVFDSPSAFLTHRGFGYLFGWLTLVLLILSAIARVRRLIGLSVLALVQFALQSVFIALRTDAPAVAALHPVNGMLLLVVAIAIGRTAWARAARSTAAEPHGSALAPDPATAR